jgi:hypothetical protein
MLNTAKQEKITAALKLYIKKYFSNNLTDLDESGTRILINTFLTDVLGYTQIEEIKTEYMIKGTYADYMVQVGGVRHFLVEVKALSLKLNESHLRQTVNYGANEGIEWALLTNGKSFEMYKILFNKPIESVKVFSIDLSNPASIKDAVEYLQYLHKDAIKGKGLDCLWSKTIALDPINVAGLLYSPQIVSHIKKMLKERYDSKFEESDIENSIKRIITESINIDSIKPNRVKKAVVKKSKPVSETSTAVETLIENVENQQN